MGLRLLCVDPLIGSYFVFLPFKNSEIVYIFYFIFYFVQLGKSELVYFWERFKGPEAIFVALKFIYEIEDFGGLLFIENKGVVGYFGDHFCIYFLGYWWLDLSDFGVIFMDEDIFDIPAYFLQLFDLNVVVGLLIFVDLSSDFDFDCFWLFLVYKLFMESILGEIDASHEDVF